MNSSKRSSKVQYDGRLVAEDMAERGLQASHVASKMRPPMSPSTVTRFLREEHQTAPVAKAIAKVLGTAVRKYIRAVVEV